MDSTLLSKLFQLELPNGKTVPNDADLLKFSHLGLYFDIWDSFSYD